MINSIVTRSRKDIREKVLELEDIEDISERNKAILFRLNEELSKRERNDEEERTSEYESGLRDVNNWLTGNLRDLPI